MSNLEIIGESPQTKALLEKIETYSPRGEPLLITGETGTGKELVVEAIGAKGIQEGKYEAFNCYSFSGDPARAEAELFGHGDGVFTGAGERKGIFERNAGGTVLLDELGGLEDYIQQKLLRVIECGHFHKPTIGQGTKKIKVECRILATSNRKKEENYGLAYDILPRFPLHIEIPPLRERPSDLIPLFLHFCDSKLDSERFNNEQCPHFKNFELPVVHQLLLHDWGGGNVRILKSRTLQYVLYRGRFETSRNARTIRSELEKQGSTDSFSANYFWFEGLEYISDREKYFLPEWLDFNLKLRPDLWASYCSITRETLEEWNAKQRKETPLSFRHNAIALLADAASKAEKRLLDMPGAKFILDLSKGYWESVARGESSSTILGSRVQSDESSSSSREEIGAVDEPALDKQIYNIVHKVFQHRGSAYSTAKQLKVSQGRISRILENKGKTRSGF